ncbi:MAG: DNA adenine methylase [Spirochaetaceae bacterium]|nr:MAG: DNA adenine methylase [Spirochaetaceae bacterium]
MPQNRKYLGSKYRLLDFLIETIVSRTGRIDVFVDLFAGTGVVGNAFRAHAAKIIANDLLYSNYVVNRAFLTSTAATVDMDRVASLIEELNHSAPKEDYAYANYAGTYFTAANAARIDGIREAIDIQYADQRCSEQERLILLASLLYAMDKAANTVGQYDAFLKHIDSGASSARADKHLIDSNVHKPLRMRLPEVELVGSDKNEVFNLDANRLIHRLEAEVLYLDPPYNTRQYVDCYHVLENILRWDKPILRGKTKKFQRDHLKSRYSRKNEAAVALEELIRSARAEHIFLSYNNEGIIPEPTIRQILSGRGILEVFSREYSVFGNGAGSARKRTMVERIFYCRTKPLGRMTVPDHQVTEPDHQATATDPQVTASARQATVTDSQVTASARQATVAGSSGKIELFDERGESRGFYSLRNRLNDLTGKEWVYWSKSVINKQYPPNLQHKLRSSHGGQKPPDLCGDLIEVFTKRGQRVLDPFAGVGGTLLGAAMRGRAAVGIEINPQWIEIYRKVCSLESIQQQRMICGDSHRILDELARDGEQFDLILTDVPYWRMDRAEKSKGKYKRVGEQQRPVRQSKLAAFNQTGYRSKEQWLREMARIFASSVALLKERGYLVVFIGDMYHSGRYHFLSSDLASILVELELVPKANLIWYDVSKSLHIYGYQYEYIPSMIHQNILVFRKQT